MRASHFDLLNENQGRYPKKQNKIGAKNHRNENPKIYVSSWEREIIDMQRKRNKLIENDTGYT